MCSSDLAGPFGPLDAGGASRVGVSGHEGLFGPLDAGGAVAGQDPVNGGGAGRRGAGGRQSARKKRAEGSSVSSR